jgi:hypothetical protein
VGLKPLLPRLSLHLEPEFGVSYRVWGLNLASCRLSHIKTK